MYWLLLLLFILWPTGAGAVITGTNHQAGGSASCDGPSHNSTSFLPSNNGQIMICVTTEVLTGSPPAVIPTITTTQGITYTQVGTALSASGQLRTTLFSGSAPAPSNALITVNISENQDNCTWAIARFDGQDVASPFAQVVTGTAASGSTGLSITLGAFADATNNAAYGCFGHSTNAAMTVGSGFTQFTATSGCCNSRAMHEWKLGEDTTVDATGSSGIYTGVAVEVKVAGAATPTRRRPPPRHYMSLDYFLAHLWVPGVIRGGYVAG